MKTFMAIVMLTAAAATVGAAVLFLPDELSELKHEVKKVVNKGKQLLK